MDPILKKDPNTTIIPNPKLDMKKGLNSPTWCVDTLNIGGDKDFMVDINEAINHFTSALD